MWSDMRVPVGLLGLLFVFTGCSTPGRTTESSGDRTSVYTHEGLNSVLWSQTSVEYAASTRQAYQVARLMLDRALADTSWTASVEQAGHPGYGNLPPAVVLDVDETVLDNSAYQAWLTRFNREYELTSWQKWVNRAEALPIPGAVEFTTYAAEIGVAVIYLTNRVAEEEEGTRRNLEQHHFPLGNTYDAVITRGEKPEWKASDKGVRRADVAARYRILLLVGDNLGDFMSNVEATVEQRNVMTEPYQSFWGLKWIMIPNPQYGSWENALYLPDKGLNREQKKQRKLESLRVMEAQ